MPGADPGLGGAGPPVAERAGTPESATGAALSSPGAGPLALVGSGEYLPEMAPMEGALLAGRAPRYVQIPTAAGREGPERLDYWIRLGKAQAERLGVEAVPVPATDRLAADDPRNADLVAGAGLVYLSGGDPVLLVETLRDTALWAAILRAWEGGAALAGCSAGAMALAGAVVRIGRQVGTDRGPESLGQSRGPLPGLGSLPGLGLLPGVVVLPHFDRMARRLPDGLLRRLPGSTGRTVLGIDERTALVGGPSRFVVQGRGAVWVLADDGERRRVGPGEALELAS